MGRPDLERLSREELIELVLRLQRPPKASRTSSKPPSTDRKERREHRGSAVESQGMRT
jgi:transposase